MESHEARVVEAMVEAYRQGYFPMAEPGRGGRPGPVGWYNPDPRGVIPLEGFHVPRSVRRVVRSGRFGVTSDRGFEGVIRGCARPRWYESGAWLDERLIGVYVALHRAGLAHSVEVWLGGTKARGNEGAEGEDQRAAWHVSKGPSQEGGAKGGVLVGGVYGVAIGGAFMAESMFCRPDLGGTDASKVALVHLVHHLRRRGFVLLDTQFWNEHIDRFGCVEIPRGAYLRRLGEAVQMRVEWGALDVRGTMAEV